MSLTLEDIARLSGFSRSTVSRVVNGDPNVSAATRKIILAVIQQQGFYPNMAARGLARGSSRVIGLVIPTGVRAIFTDPFFPLLIQGVSSECNTHDYSVMLWLAEPEYERRMIARIMNNGFVDGVIVSSMLLDDSIIASLLKGQQPFVLVGRHPTSPSASFVDVDNRSGAREAVRHLLGLGRQRVATICGSKNMIAGQDRLDGYCDALSEHGITPQDALVFEGDFTDESGYLGMQHLLQFQPDAVFAASDTMALGALRALKDANLRIPEDVALVGFDDLPAGRHAAPALTTVRQSIQTLGAVAAETLIALIEESAAPPQRVVLPVELVVRASCGANPG